MTEFVLQVVGNSLIETNWEYCVVDCIKILERCRIAQ